MPAAKIAVEFIKRNSAIAAGHAGKSFLDGSEVVSRRLGIGMLTPPFVERLFWRTSGALLMQLGAKELVKGSQFLNCLSRHRFLP